jgi:ribose transport system ATP-binding protein
MTTTICELAGVTHRYGATVALDDCHLEIREGEIHGLVGENGSGKSTVVKLLSGIMRPTAGEIRVAGRAAALRSPAHAQRNDIQTVFQETLIADECTGLDNVFAGTDGVFRRTRSRTAELTAATEVMERLGAASSLLTASPFQLTLAERQLLTLVRALVRPWRLLILDEATSALDLAARDRLFDVLREERDKGGSVLLVSHRMDELQAMIDRATVLRSGRTIGTVDREQASPARLLGMMDGRGADERRVESVVRRDRVDRGPAARLDGVTLDAARPPIDLEIRRGEILGVAGLDGHGGVPLLETIAGVRAPASGRVLINRSGEWTTPRDYRGAVAAGVAYVPGKRQEEGLFRTLNVRDNLAMATYRRWSRLGVFRPSTVADVVGRQMRRLAVHPDDQRYPITGLSGGNAQKVLVGRWLAAQPDVLVLADPLRGVDVGTKREFYALLRELTDDGMTVVMLSTEIEELLTVSDRVAVCHDRTVATVLAADHLTHDRVLSAMFGQRLEPSLPEGATT